MPEFNPDTEYRLFIDNMKRDIAVAIDGCFGGESDPVVCWDVFRDALRKFKKEHTAAYEKYMESDVE